MKTSSSMKNVSEKPATLRWAAATARLIVGPSTLNAVKRGKAPKADPFGVAKIAAIQAAKRTSEFIPFCHPIPLDAVGVTVASGKGWIDVEVEVTAIWKTGVEMEALTAATAGALTLYDMLKPLDKRMRISSVKLLGKTGGRSGQSGSGKGRRAAVLVISGQVSAGHARDTSGKYLVEKLREMKTAIPVYRVIPDDAKKIGKALRDLADRRGLDLILTTGGTGISPKDVTADVVQGLIGKRLHGVEEAYLRYGQDRCPTAMLSRCVAGVRKKSLIVALPGSPGAVADAVAVLFPVLFHVFQVMGGTRHRGNAPGKK